MVKIKGPLSSTAASGSVGGALTFATWKGRPYVRELVKPKNPNSGKQNSLRVMLGFLSGHWSQMTDARKNSWIPRASQKGISPFNAFVGANMSKWRSFLGISLLPDWSAQNNNGELQLPNITAGRHMLTVEIDLDYDRQSWVVMLFRAKGAPVTPAFNNLVWMQAIDGPTPYVFVDTPLDPGTYHYNWMLCTDDAYFTLANFPLSASPTT